MKKMSKITRAVWIGLIPELLLAVLGIILLPGQIAIQWQGSEAVQMAPRYAILLYPAVSLFLALVGRQAIALFLSKFSVQSARLLPGAYRVVHILILTCEVYTILYAFGFRLRISLILILELVLLAVAAVFRRILLPKPADVKTDQDPRA